MKLMAEQFVMGRTIGDALARSREQAHAAYLHSYDMLGEAAFTAADAERYFAAYEAAIDAIAAFAGRHYAGVPVFGAPGISIKLSALHPRYEYAQRERVLAELTPRVEALCRARAPRRHRRHARREEAERLGLSLEIFERVFLVACARGVGRHRARGAGVPEARALRSRVAARPRAPRRRAHDDAAREGRLLGHRDQARAVQGLAGYPVYTRKCNTDVSYLACAARMLAAPEAFYPQFATHNAHTVATILERARDGQPFEFQRLHGMGEDLYEQVVAAGHACRVYAPVGSHEDLLPYLVRRLLENGANTSFVNRIADPAIPIESVIVDPIATAESNTLASNPRIPLPRISIPIAATRAAFAFADEPSPGPSSPSSNPFVDRAEYASAPLVAGEALEGGRRDVADPASGRRIGEVVEADERAVEAALAAASRAAPSRCGANAPRRSSAPPTASRRIAWSSSRSSRARPGRPCPTRWARCAKRPTSAATTRSLRGATSAQPEILVGPTGESNALQLTGRGPFVCISPWNFPLAIFVGQVAAAFAAGTP
jgi:RHH-type proline utilization regulon transcriptional repressor/proline dehydrogenase/delta 1-pyrroline-5-carboxylate dehydrogenase